MIQACYHGDAEVVRELVKDLSSAELQNMGDGPPICGPENDH